MADERIRVAHVITRMIVGGAQETVLLAAALADRERFDPIVVCGPQTGSEGSLQEEVRRRGVELVVLPQLVREVHPLKDVRALHALTGLFRDRKIDIVHTNSSKAGILGRAAARRAGVGGLVHTVHGWPFHEHQSPVVATTWRALERWAARGADRLVVVADADRDKGLAAGIGSPEQYITVRSSLELAGYDAGRPLRNEVREELGVPLGAPLVGTVNRLSKQKDPLTLLEAFAAVHAQRPDARLVVVGGGPLAEQMHARVASLGLGKQVSLMGLRHDVPRLLQALDVFVSTSLWEGLPRSIIAAMATGIPVVATPVDGVADIVRDGQTGLVVAPGQPAAVAGAIMRLIDDPAEGVRVATAALAVSRTFDAAQMVAALERLYLDVASARPTTPV